MLRRRGASGKFVGSRDERTRRHAQGTREAKQRLVIRIPNTALQVSKDRYMDARGVHQRLLRQACLNARQADRLAERGVLSGAGRGLTARRHAGSLAYNVR
jgi:hypothetical protein